MLNPTFLRRLRLSGAFRRLPHLETVFSAMLWYSRSPGLCSTLLVHGPKSGSGAGVVSSELRAVG